MTPLEEPQKPTPSTPPPLAISAVDVNPLAASAVVEAKQERQTSLEGNDDGHSKSIPRLPRWTRHEILVLIEGKRVVESQVRKARTGPGGGSIQVEPKWVSISSYCKRHGVNREPVQCRKRWSNLAGDYRKIKEWEAQIKEEADSFWIMRNDLRRERKLPGFFDREIFDVLDSANVNANANATETGAVTGTELVPVTEQEGGLAIGVSLDEEEEEDALFDSGRTAAAEDGLFSDFEQQSKQEDEEMGETPTTHSPKSIAPAPLPIAERRYQPLYKAFFDQGRAASMKQPTSTPNPEKGSPSNSGQKKRRLSPPEDATDSTLQEELVKVLETNNKMLAAQLEAQNVNCHLDRDQRKDQGDSLIGVLNKLADALGRIADKI